MARVPPGLASSTLVLLASGCATAQLRPGPPPRDDPGTPRVVVVEPLFEAAGWTVDRTVEWLPSGTPGTEQFVGPYDVPQAMQSWAGTSPWYVDRPVKPTLARADVLADVHRRVRLELQRLRPSWQVRGPSELSGQEGAVTLVRTVMWGDELVESDRTGKIVAFVFGCLVPPLLFIQLDPVSETVRVHGLLELAELPSAWVPGHLVWYRTQPDAAVDLADVPRRRWRLRASVSYDEGLLADTTPRPSVIIDGFVRRLAVSIITVLEGGGAATDGPVAGPTAER